MRISSTWLAWLGLAGSLGGAAPARAALGPDEVVIGDWADRSVRIVSCADGRTIARVPGLQCFTRTASTEPPLVRLAEGRLVTTLRDSGREGSSAARESSGPALGSKHACVSRPLLRQPG